MDISPLGIDWERDRASDSDDSSIDIKMEAVMEAEAEILANLELNGPDYELDEDADGATPMAEQNVLPQSVNIDEMEIDTNRNHIIQWEDEVDDPCQRSAAQSDQAHVLQDSYQRALVESMRTREEENISEAIRRSQNDLIGTTSDISEAEQIFGGHEDMAGAGYSTDIDCVQCVMCLEHFDNRLTYFEHMRTMHNVVQTKLQMLFHISKSITYKKTDISWPAGEIISHNRGKKRRSDTDLSHGEREKRMCLESNSVHNLASSSGSVVSEVWPGDSVSLIGHNHPSPPENQQDCQDTVGQPPSRLNTGQNQ